MVALTNLKAAPVPDISTSFSSTATLASVLNTAISEAANFAVDIPRVKRSKKGVNKWGHERKTRGSMSEKEKKIR